jgi:hypothetical protein
MGLVRRQNEECEPLNYKKSKNYKKIIKSIKEEYIIEIKMQY